MMTSDSKKNIKNIQKNRKRLPDWIRVKVHSGINRKDVNRIVRKHRLHTVCESAKCPNLGECWHKRTATFMILGETCTRNCKFCAVSGNKPEKIDFDEPRKVAEAIKELGLKYAVITSVTRDDLDDDGAEHFAEVIKKIREYNGEDFQVEVLTPDFGGKIELLKIVLDANPTVFNHNLETVERLTPKIRQDARYYTSLKILNSAFKYKNGYIPVKSGIMVGMGETDQEVKKTINDLKEAGATILTIGQYLPPSSVHWSLDRYVKPKVFEEWKEYAFRIGFKSVASAPLVRSSYQADELNKEANHG